ncbi:hypothetical protein F4808DRAFT_409620 [Astrocystis sublimbata]|nr:hypothetical protein F4808DRAFT_409620 [Astrocystis sublimbata]
MEPIFGSDGVPVMDSNDLSFYDVEFARDAANIIFDLNGERISVSIWSPNYLPGGEGILINDEDPCLEDIIINLLNHVDCNDSTRDLIISLLVKVGEDVFGPVAPKHRAIDTPQARDLHSLIYPAIHTFRYSTEAATQTAFMFPIPPTECYGTLLSNHTTVPSSTLDPSLPRISTEDLIVQSCIDQNEWIGAKYYVTLKADPGQDRLCHIGPYGKLNQANLDSIKRMIKLRDALEHGHRAIRFPVISEFVTHAKEGRYCVVGYLVPFIPGATRLQDMDMSRVPYEKKRELASHITQTISELYDLGIPPDGQLKYVEVVIDNKSGLPWVQGMEIGDEEPGIQALENAADIVDQHEEALTKMMQLLGFQDRIPAIVVTQVD